MSQLLSQALDTLVKSVDQLEQACVKSETAAKATRGSQHQNDLFGALYGKASGKKSNNDGGVDREAMTKVLDRTIARVEKMVEGA